MLTNATTQTNASQTASRPRNPKLQNLTKYFASNFYLPFVSSTTTGEIFFFPRLVGVFTHGGGFRIAATVCTLV